MEDVIIASCEEYNRKAIREMLEEALGELSFSAERAKILLKPNLVIGKTPERAVNTHPELIGAVAECFLERGCQLAIGDSPGFESTEKALINSNIMSIIEEYDLRIAPFNTILHKRWHGISPYKEFVICEDPDEYDLVVNLPKLKTHGQMGMTLGVKNTFGFVRGTEKARWHLKAGRDPFIFASLLIDIHNIVRPSLTILDGVLGMDGEGPTHGRPKKLGLLAVSKSAFSLDDAIETFFELHHFSPVISVARQTALVPRYKTTFYGSPRKTTLIIPETMPADWSLPKPLKKILRKIFLKKPKPDSRLCKKCNVCVNVCPTGSLKFVKDQLEVNYEKCIRCYCCQEMCPEGAIRLTLW